MVLWVWKQVGKIRSNFVRLNLATSSVYDGCYFFRRYGTTVKPLVNRWLANAANICESLLAANDF